MKYECVLGININGFRIRQGDIVSDDDPKNAAFVAVAKAKPKNFVVAGDEPKEDPDVPMTISDIAKARQFQPAAKVRK